jgi:hypothetical protein
VNTWFGQSWGAPCNEDTEHVETPVGQLCIFCEEAIEETDSGVMVSSWDKGAAEFIRVPLHVDCHIADAVGSVAHQQKRCRCYGGIEEHDEDNWGLSRREAAKAAVAYFERTHQDW